MDRAAPEPDPFIARIDARFDALERSLWHGVLLVGGAYTICFVILAIVIVVRF